MAWHGMAGAAFFLCPCALVLTRPGVIFMYSVCNMSMYVVNVCLLQEFGMMTKMRVGDLRGRAGTPRAALQWFCFPTGLAVNHAAAVTYSRPRKVTKRCCRAHFSSLAGSNSDC